MGKDSSSAFVSSELSDGKTNLLQHLVSSAVGDGDLEAIVGAHKVDHFRCVIHAMQTDQHPLSWHETFWQCGEGYTHTPCQLRQFSYPIVVFVGYIFDWKSVRSNRKVKVGCGDSSQLLPGTF